MSHATEGLLRRLTDEPWAVPDAVRDHAVTCPRCSARRLRVTQDAERCARVLSGPQLAPDLDIAWARLRLELRRRVETGDDRRRITSAIPRGSLRPRRVSLRTGVVIGVAALVVAGTAAAATLTTVFAPVRVAPLPLSQGDLQEVAAFMGMSGGHVLAGFPRPNGSASLPFGTIKWSSAGKAETVRSLAQARAAAGFGLRLPTQLPSGVGTAEGYVVQPRVRATVTFSAGAPGVGGSSVVIDAGPAVLVEYGSSSGASLPTMAVLAMPRPTAVSSGATTGQIETFLLKQKGIPRDLAGEIRLLGNLRTTFPVPVPPGASSRYVHIDGRLGVLVADSSNAVAAVVWEDAAGTLHLVAGLLDPQDVLHVATQLG